MYKVLIHANRAERADLVLFNAGIIIIFTAAFVIIKLLAFFKNGRDSLERPDRLLLLLFIKPE